MTHRTRDSQAVLIGEFVATIVRANGTVEHRHIGNIVTRTGLNRLANRALLNTATPAYALGVGTVTAAASLDSVNFGEVSRKASATQVQSREWFALTATWGGASDTLTGVVLDSACILDHTSSGQGGVWNMANALAVTLQGSDTLALTARIRVGSHDLSHST